MEHQIYEKDPRSKHASSGARQNVYIQIGEEKTGAEGARKGNSYVDTGRELHRPTAKDHLVCARTRVLVCVLVCVLACV